MKNFKEKLKNLEIPKIEDDPFEDELRNNILNKYFTPEIKYKHKLKFAYGLAGLFAVFLILTLIKPQIAYKINQLAFQKSEEIEFPSEGDYLLRDDMVYTSIYNPTLTEKIDPNRYTEDKAYIIRRYKSRNNETVMIVSEFDQKANYSPTKITY
ncbi:MAG: hypothetical protein KAW92_08720 [Candidatus Cloacimonetes bacterium]|nr:hypothetical protein [Candidatus Cloacimonadota bacterium]